MNLIDIVKGLIGDDLIHKLSSLIGESSDRTHTAVNAALPALLAGLSNVASSGADGARKLTSALETPGLGDLNRYTNMLGTNQESILQKGTALLNTLFGEGKITATIRALSSYLGLGSSSIKSLLAGLMPLVLGAVLKQKQTQGLSAAGLAEMLAAQKQNALNAMPSGLSSALAGVPGMGAVADAARAGYAGARSAADQVAGQGATALRWLVPLALLLGLGLLLWNYYGRQPAPPTTSAPAAAANRTAPAPAPDTPTTTTSARIDPSAPAVPAPDAARLTGDLKDIFQSATNTLTGIKDAASAQAALPEIEKLNAKLDSVRALWDKMPAAAKGAVASLVKNQTGTIQELIDKVMALPGVGEKVKPALDAMVSKLKAFTT